MKHLNHTIIATAHSLFLTLVAGAGTCVVPNNGGTANFPPACPNGYRGPMKIVNGLPASAQINIDARLTNFNVTFTGPGGSLGGQVQQFSSTLQLTLSGTGSLAGYNRFVSMQVQCETHTGPRTPGQPLQSFPTDMFRMQGQLPAGDPDFDLLRITAGTAFGMPSPGHTTLTQQAGGWAVDSFFDVTYRIDFVGHPGGAVSGLSGSTNSNSHIQTNDPVAKLDAWQTWGRCVDNYLFIQSPPIPADFFGPGSQPFFGSICYSGQPLGATPFGEFDVADTIIRRPAGDPFDRVDLPGTVNVPIEMVALDLKSVNPIIVTYSGQSPQQWNVQINLSNIPAPAGTMTATKTHANGGTFDATIYVQPRFTFTKVSNPSDVRVLDTGEAGNPPIIFHTDNVPWVHDLDPNFHFEGGCCTDFHPGVADSNFITGGGQTLTAAHLLAPGAAHGLYPALIPVLCPADISPPGGNGSVNVGDLLAVINSWGAAGGAADINHDGIVNVIDLLAVINAWGPCP